MEMMKTIKLGSALKEEPHVQFQSDVCQPACQGTKRALTDCRKCLFLLSRDRKLNPWPADYEENVWK